MYHRSSNSLKWIVETKITMPFSSGWLPDFENLGNLEIRPGGLENFEKQVFISEKP